MKWLGKSFLSSLGKMARVWQGFLTAKLVTEALQRAGRQPTPARFMSALETLKDHDFGGFFVTFTPADHSGGKFVKMSIIDERGEFLQ
jgi:ABC-type branched-subunit amino acid transport system substrate-binding protein